MTPSRCTLQGLLRSLALLFSSCNLFLCVAESHRVAFLSLPDSTLALGSAHFGSFVAFTLFLLPRRWPVGWYKGLLFFSLKHLAQHAGTCYCICKQCTPVHLHHPSYIINLSQSEVQSVGLSSRAGFFAQRPLTLMTVIKSVVAFFSRGRPLAVLCFICFLGCFTELAHAQRTCNLTLHVLGLWKIQLCCILECRCHHNTQGWCG